MKVADIWIMVKEAAWRDGSVGIVYVMQAQEPEF